MPTPQRRKALQNYDALFKWRRPLAPLPLAAFDTEENRRRPARTELGALYHDFNAACHMAGWRYRPTFVEFTDRLREHDVGAEVLAYLRELFVQLPPLDRRMIVQHSGVTRYEWAKALIASGVTSPRLTIWLNHWTPGYRTPQLFSKAVDFWGLEPPGQWLVPDEELRRMAGSPL